MRGMGRMGPMRRELRHTRAHPPEDELGCGDFGLADGFIIRADRRCLWIWRSGRAVGYAERHYG